MFGIGKKCSVKDMAKLLMMVKIMVTSRYKKAKHDKNIKGCMYILFLCKSVRKQSWDEGVRAKTFQDSIQTDIEQGEYRLLKKGFHYSK